MKKIILELFWHHSCNSLIEGMSGLFGLLYPGLSVILKGGKNPPVEAFDSFRQKYDAQYLLQVLEGNKFSLWVVEVDIGDANHLFLYGAATKNKAVVSTFQVGSIENLLKEICHEIGHMLGLEHCRNNCVMKPSKNIFELNKKGLILCRDCKIKLGLII